MRRSSPELPLPATIPSHRLSLLHKLLWRWYDAEQRQLPWRENRDPYRIWVSEVMLQQTTVAAVIPCFRRFIQRFPTLQSLAAADEQAVLACWSGLGYYRRARHLHQAARQLYQCHGDRLPSDPQVWARLPGVGRYILGAVLSQAFDHRLPIVEANSLRVLTRLWAYAESPYDSAGQKWLWQAAERLLPTTRTGDFNQALMELGALICTPATPACHRCPLAGFCQAHQQNLQASIPRAKPSRRLQAVREVALILREQSRFFLVRRPTTAKRWPGFWEFPHAAVHEGESDEDAACRIARDFLGFTIQLLGEPHSVKHTVTRWQITLVGWEATVTSGDYSSPFYSEGRWLESSAIQQFPVCSPQRKLLAAALRPRPPRLF